MVETRALLRECADLLRHLSGAASATIAVPGVTGDAPWCCLRAGDHPPVPELATPDLACDLERRFAAGEIQGARDPEELSTRIDDAHSGSVIYRVPAFPPDSGQTADGPRRRATDRGVGTGIPLWVGLRLRPDPDRSTKESPLDSWRAPEAWGRALLHAASVVAHGLNVAGALEDPMTGLPDRNGLRAALGHALDKAVQRSASFGLMLINPHRFEEVNEKHGRSSGDRVLRELADGVRAAVRSSDAVARYGAATFAVILADAEAEATLLAAEKIRRDLEEGRYLDGTVRLRLNLGVVCIAPGDLGPSVDVSEWIHRAEQALSQARREGGDHTRMWSPDLADRPAESVERLQGLFTGDVNRDYRNMALLWEVVRTVATSRETADLAGRIVSRIDAWMPFRVVSIVERSPGSDPAVVAALVEGAEPAETWCLPEEQAGAVARLLEAGDDDRPSATGRAIPLDAGGRRIGCLYLEAFGDDGDIAFSDRRFLEAVASQVAIALDRSRLDEAERERREEEKQILVSEVRELRRVFQAGQLAYRSEPMQALMDRARRVAPTEATVLVTGESGAGKEILAQTLHQLGDRRDRPLVIVDCGAISASLLESELFGHEKGAFTGASARKKGRLLEADGATVFLDEIGELPIDLQSKLLRFVQEKTLIPVGGTKPVRVDARIIAATNVDLATKVQEGGFREDLYHRLNVVHLRMPSLRERPDDIPHLANLFVQQYATLYRKDGLRLTDDAVRLLVTHGWPGNVRELQNRVMRAVLFADEDRLRPEHFPDLGGQPATPGSSSGDPAPRLPAAPDPTAEPSERRSAVDPLGHLTTPDLRARIRELLEREVHRSIVEAQGGRPLGKWLESDLVLVADRVAGFVARRAAALLGLPDTTFRRRLSKARRAQRAGLDARTDSWNAVMRAVETLVSAQSGSSEGLAATLEGDLLEVIHERSPDVDTGAALLGVTVTTYLRRVGARQLPSSRAVG